MIKPIIKGISIFKEATLATRDDVQVAIDLADTLHANSDKCVGMSAGMIGINKRIIAIAAGPFVMSMINPVIIKKSRETYEDEEACLSLDGFRKTVRHEEIEVEYYDNNFKKHRQVFTGYAAQIIQHEIYNCDGIVI